ncbi:hypothetical protein, partial [Bacillus licheniformis]|uniref:hypothetical protein n=1 Tax=Bacillus licheniformis TaxID=1402 RepID=UPI001C894108
GLGGDVTPTGGAGRRDGGLCEYEATSTVYGSGGSREDGRDDPRRGSDLGAVDRQRARGGRGL